MGIINIVENVKKIHPEYVVFVNIGKFYYTYGRDSYIISYLFNYKLNKFDNISSFANRTRSSNQRNCYIKRTAHFIEYVGRNYRKCYIKQ